MKILIKTLTGKLVELSPISDKWTTVSELKQQYQDNQGTPPDEQRLIYNGHQLEDEYILDHYNIVNGSTIYLVTKLRGD